MYEFSRNQRIGHFAHHLGIGDVPWLQNLQRIGGVLDFSNVQSQIDSTFVSCAALEEVTFAGSIHVDVAVNGCPKLTVTSLLSLLNALAPGVTDKECRIGSKNLAKLSAEQQAIATDKGWTLI